MTWADFQARRPWRARVVRRHLRARLHFFGGCFFALGLVKLAELLSAA